MSIYFAQVPNKIYVCQYIKDQKLPKYYVIGKNILLVPTFLTNSYFGPYFDFATIPVPKNKTTILFWSLPSTHWQKTPTW